MKGCRHCHDGYRHLASGDSLVRWKAAEQAINSSLLETSICRCFLAFCSLYCRRTRTASKLMKQLAWLKPLLTNANIIYGQIVDPGLGDTIRVLLCNRILKRPAASCNGFLRRNNMFAFYYAASSFYSEASTKPAVRCILQVTFCRRRLHS